MEIKVYQLVVPRTKQDENGKTVLLPKEESKCYFNVIGTVSGDHIDLETVWHLTNHSCWNNKTDEEGSTIEEEYWPIQSDNCIYRPTVYDRGYTNDDICFEIVGTWFCADSCGWTQVKSKEEAIRHLYEHSFWVKDYLPETHTIDDIIER